MSSVSENGSAAPAAVKDKSLFASRAFNLLFLGSLLGKLADRLYYMALIVTALAVFAGQGADKEVGIITIVATVPLVFAYTFMGALIDEVDRRRLMYGLMAVKAFVAVGFIPFLWNVRTGDYTFVHEHWSLALALVFLLSLIDSPFGPARAAAVPDVSTTQTFRLAASLVAASGLISLLLGSFLGNLAARPSGVGPVNTIFIALGCYAFSALFLRLLPNAVAVPGKARAKAVGAAEPATPKIEPRGYLKDLAQGFSYAWKTRGVLQLVGFETLFWCFGTTFYLLFLGYLDFKLHLRPDDTSDAFAFVLGATGVGLVLGALAAGKLSRRASPIVTYPLAFVIMGIGGLIFFSSPGNIEKRDAQSCDLINGDCVEVRDGGGSFYPARIYAITPIPKDAQKITVARNTEKIEVPRASIQVLLVGTSSGHLLLRLSLAGWILGLGGGLMLGRVDADVLSIADEQMRGRVFSIKAIGFTAALLGTMGLLIYCGEDARRVLASWFGVVMIVFALPAFAMSWFVDVAIWANNTEPRLPGRVYLLCRLLARLLARILFRFEVVGLENVPATGPVVLAANHASYIDPILLGCGTDRIVQYIMHASYYRSLAHPVFRFLCCIPVDERNQLQAIRAGVRSLELGACIGIFPEGHIADDGKLQKPQSGGLFLAQRVGAPVVPIAIKGNYEAWPRRQWLPKLRKIKVVVGKPLPTSKDMTRKQMAEFTDNIMVWIAQQLEVEPPPKSAEKYKEESKGQS